MLNSIVILVVIQVLLLMPSFFYYRKIIKKFNFKYPRLLNYLAVILMPSLYTSIFILLYIGVFAPIWRSKTFEPIKWCENKSIRYRMVNDLISSELLIGKTKKEVEKYLGIGFKENCWTKNTYCYFAPDPDNYAFLDHYELVVFFGLDHKVKRVEYLLI